MTVCIVVYGRIVTVPSSLVGGRLSERISLDGRVGRSYARAVLAFVVAAAALAVCSGSALASTPGVLTRFAGSGSFGAPGAGTASSHAIELPEATALDPSGDLFIADAGNFVEKVSTDGSLSVFAGTGVHGVPTPGPASSSRLYSPAGVASDASGDVFVADSQNNAIEEITPGGALSVFAGQPGMAAGTPTPGQATGSLLDRPTGVATDAVGDVYIADANNDVVEKVDPSGVLSVVAGTVAVAGPASPGTATATDLDSPNAVAVGPNGDLYIADSGNNEIEQVTPAGQLTIIAGQGPSNSGAPTTGPATSSLLDDPTGVAVDADNDVFVADSGNNQVEQITPQGTLTIVAGSGAVGTPNYGTSATGSPFNGVNGIVVDQHGALYISDVHNHTVDRVAPPAPSLVSAASITGAASVGQTVTAEPGTWSPVPTSYAYQWERCDATGAGCDPITAATEMTYAVTSEDVGHTLRVVISAVNESGSTQATAPQTSVVATAASMTTVAPVTTTTTTSATTEGVSLSARAARAGVDVSPTGGLALPLICPTTVTGCNADGLLTLALPGMSSHAALADVAAPISSSVLARFAGIQIEAGHGRLVSVHLTPAATRYLQTRGIHRVRVTLTIHNHLSGGPSVSTTQVLWLDIAGLQASCPAALGTLSASHIAQMRLGLTRRQAHHVGPHRKAGYGFERYCLTGGKIRVRYPSHKLLAAIPAGQRQRVAGRVYLALTTNRHYAVGRVHTSTTVASARSHLRRLGTGVTVGKNTWYVVPTRRGAWVLKAQHGIIREIGITTRSLTRTAQSRRLLKHNI